MRRPPPRTQAEPIVGDKRANERRAGNSRILFGTVIVIAVLHLAKPVVVPVALAVLFAFLLTPIVVRLERTFIRRTGAIVLSLGLTTVLLSIGGWWIYQQFNAVAQDLATAATSENIEEKLRFLRSTSGGALEVVERTLQRFAEVNDRAEKPDLKVRVIPERKTLGQRYEEMAPTAEGRGGDLPRRGGRLLPAARPRAIARQAPAARRPRASDGHDAGDRRDVGQRISRYLLTIALLNIGFGVLIGFGLWLLRVPHAPLWGVLAGLLRFVPYIGAVLSAAAADVPRLRRSSRTGTPRSRSSACSCSAIS